MIKIATVNTWLPDFLVFHGSDSLGLESESLFSPRVVYAVEVMTSHKLAHAYFSVLLWCWFMHIVHIYHVAKKKRNSRYSRFFRTLL